MAEASRKYKQTQETEQRERYQRPMREQIEGLIAEMDAIDGDFYNYGWDTAIDMFSSRLRAILDSEN